MVSGYGLLRGFHGKLDGSRGFTARFHGVLVAGSEAMEWTGGAMVLTHGSMALARGLLAPSHGSMARFHGMLGGFHGGLDWM